MTEAFSKSTYGLLSKTILNTLANDTVSVEKTFTFSLYLQWGIIMACPGIGSKNDLLPDVLQWITQQEPDKCRKISKDDLKKLFTASNEVFYEIFEHITAAMLPDKFKWYKKWEAHCNHFLSQHPSPRNCCQLLEIVKNSMDLKFEELFISISLLNEVLNTHANRQLV